MHIQGETRLSYAFEVYLLKECGVRSAIIVLITLALVVVLTGGHYA